MAHRFQYTVISILSAVLQKCGLRCTRKFGKMLGLLLMLQTKRRMITYDNISKAYPGHSDEWKGALVRGAYVNLGITFAEMLYSKALSADDLINQVTFSGLDVVAERARNGLPSILLSGHFGNWEYLAMAAGVCLHKPLTIVVHPQHNAYLDAELNTIRPNEILSHALPYPKTHPGFLCCRRYWRGDGGGAGRAAHPCGI